MSRASRRGVLGGFAALASAPVPVLASTAATAPDTALLAACASYMEKQAAYCAAYRQECAATDAGDKAEARRFSRLQCQLAQSQEEPLGFIIKTMALTQAGKAAKAAVAMTLVETWATGEPMSNEAAMLWSLAEDLAGKPLEPTA